jgi:hypothetical protein
MHILVDDGFVISYPYSPARLRTDNPQVSFPDEMSDALLAEWGVYPVTPTPRPAADHTRNVAEAPAQQIDGVWMQAWVVTDLAPEELTERLAEWRQGMLVSPLQMRRALRAENLYNAIAAYVEQQDADTQDAWEYAVEIRRNDALIASAAAALGKTDVEVDDLFRLAASL